MNRRYAQEGFALPSIIITSLVMFTLVTAIVGTVSSIKVALDTQYYRALARDAAESGANYAKICLYEPSFAVGDTIDPTKTCKKVSGSYTSSGKADRWLINNSTASGSTKFRTTYDASLMESNNDGKRMTVTGKVELLRTSDSSVWRTYTWVTNVQMTKKIDPEGDRASKRFWYFGRWAGLDFGTTGNTLQSVIEFPIDPSLASGDAAGEGATVTNDQRGNFLFWSNGLTIWNKAGLQMSDDTGDLTPLKGDNSTSQGGLSFPLNSARTKYGIVTNNTSWERGQGELYMHTIDMTRDGGNGAIVSKNIPLSTTLGTGWAGEALGAMPNADGSGYYVYTFKTGTSNATTKVTRFLISLNGAISGQVQFDLPAPPKICKSPKNNGVYGFGSMSFNKDYSKVLFTAGAFNCSNDTTPTDYASGRVYLYTTDRSTGNLTPVADWTVENSFDPTASYASTIQYVRHALYDSDFSPSERYVYTMNKFPGRLTRFDISSGISATIKASEWDVPDDMTSINPGESIVASPDINSGGHIKTAPDGRMYIANASWNWNLQDDTPRPYPYKMSYIGKPDATTPSTASIDLNIDGITLLNGTSSNQSLPQMATVYVPEIIIY